MPAKTPSKIRNKIRKEAFKGIPKFIIAEKYGVSRVTVYNLTKDISYRNSIPYHIEKKI